MWNWDSDNPDATDAACRRANTYTRNSANMWSLASVDEKLGMVYLPMGNQTPDQWGADRTPGAEKFSCRPGRSGPGHRQSALELPVHSP